ncbi:MAG: AAA family ATPase, partial [Verrucomicrobia bacterium]|nr:AAA family ATPase [Verrucomicrobiota bacterium]
MRLKRLTLVGFKSFADKTSLEFQPGVTAIVGPNGCGKSNIADAIRWVLGEQSARALRGSAMADVIFNGTESRKPLAMAEVSLTIEGVEPDRLKSAGVSLDFSEITVSRRVYRDGAGEYFLNRTPCRLRDIQHLFAGTGMGRAAYSIMAQGNITQILSSRPEERRVVFEEAAGITRFKAQKKEALRKLEQTEQNLTRVADLIGEVKRRIGSLQRQAAKARRYRRYAEQLELIETRLARRQWEELSAKLAAAQAELDRLRADRQEAENALAEAETKGKAAREQAAALQERRSEVQRRGVELEAQIRQAKYQIETGRRRIRELAEQAEAAAEERDRALARRREALEEIRRLETEVAEQAAALRAAEEELEQKEAAAAELDASAEGLEKELERLHEVLFDTAGRSAETRNRIRTLERQIASLDSRREKLRAEAAALEKEEAGRREEAERAEREIQEAAAELA